MVPFEMQLGGLSAHGNGALACEKVDVVDIMGGLLQEQAAGLGRVAVPAVIINAAVGDIVDGLHHRKPAQHAAVHNALHLQCDGGKAQRE